MTYFWSFKHISEHKTMTSWIQQLHNGTKSKLIDANQSKCMKSNQIDVKKSIFLNLASIFIVCYPHYEMEVF